MAAHRAQLAAERQQAQEAKARMAAEAAAKAQAAAAERIAAEQRAQALASMTAQAQATEQLRQACEELAAKLLPHGNFKKAPADPNKAGLYQDATRLVKTALESADWNATDRTALADMLQAMLPTVIAGWDVKEQRKKLQLAKLRGEA